MNKPCPICKKSAPQNKADNAWRPFCSERCRNLDLANWLDGTYAVPGEKVPQQDNREDY